MFRWLLAIYMIFMLVAGPSLCCCTITFASSPSSTSHSSRTSSSCCCQDKSTAQPSKLVGDEYPAKQTPKPGNHECPCKSKTTKQTLDQPSPSLTAEELARLLTATCQYVPVLFTAHAVAISTIESGGESSPLGRLIAWRLLYVHHMLRC